MFTTMLISDAYATAHLMMGIALVTISVVGLVVTIKLCASIIYGED